MISERAVSSLIAQLYEAAGNRPLWPGFLENLAEALDGTGTQLIRFNTQSRSGEVVASARVNPEYVKSYNDYYIGKDFWALCSARYFQEPNVITGKMICTDEELERSEFGADFLRPMDALHMIGAVTVKDGDELSVLTSLRPKRAGEFGQDEIAVMETLLPHLERALQFQRRLAALEMQSSVLTGALDRIPLGVILVDSSGKVLLANRAAEVILAKLDGLSSTPGGLEAARSSETITLRGLIYSACAAASFRNLLPGGAMSISRPSLKRRFSVLVVPVLSKAFDMPGAQPAAILFISDAEAQTQPNEAVISSLFGLTRAESRIAALLMQGKSMEQISEELGVSLNTARSHAKRILSKTGTGRQGELISLLLGSPAQLHFS